MSRAEYEEYGEGFLKTHFSSNIYTPTPATPPPPSDTPATPPPPTDTPSTPPLPTVVAGAELPTWKYAKIYLNFSISVSTTKEYNLFQHYHKKKLYVIFSLSGCDILN